MKRFLFTLGVLVTLAATTAFASEVKVSASIMHSFKSKFAGAESISWSQANGFTIAEFTLDDTKQFAYFDGAGELTVVAQPLTVKQLSKAQQANLRKKYKEYTVVDLYQLDDSNEIKYFAVVENDSKKLILSTTSSRWDVVKTTNK